MVEEIKHIAESNQAVINGLRDRIDRMERDSQANQGVIDAFVAKSQDRKLPSLGPQTKALQTQVENAIRIEDLDKLKERAIRDVTFHTKSTTLDGNFSGGTASISNSPIGITGTIYQPQHLLEILPRVNMTTSNLPIVKEGAVVGGFDSVAEGDAKPPIDFNLSESPAKAEVVAAIVKVSRQMFNDLGSVGFSQWMTKKMTELYQVKMDSQLLVGDGVSPNIKGINVAGNFTAATATTGPHLEQLVNSLVQLRILGRSASWIIINPASIPALLLNVATGSGEYDVPPVVTIRPDGGFSVMGVPVFDTVSQTANTFTIIDNSGMVVGDRESFSIRIFEQDSDDVQKNMLTIRAESRTAFAVYAATYAIKGTFSV